MKTTCEHGTFKYGRCAECEDSTQGSKSPVVPCYMDTMEKRSLCPFTFVRPMDDVFSKTHGHGKVTDCSYGQCYLTVVFDDGTEKNCTLSGYFKQHPYSDEQDIYWDEGFTKKPMMPEDIYKRNSYYESNTFGYGG